MLSALVQHLIRRDVGLHTRCDAVLKMGDDEPGLRFDGNIKLLQQLGFQSYRVSEVKDVGLGAESVGAVRRIKRIRCVPLFGIPICGETGGLSKIRDGIILNDLFFFPFVVVVAQGIERLAALTLCVLISPASSKAKI